MITATEPVLSRSLSGKAILRSVRLTGPAGRLEALLNEGAPGARFAALVCHPYPPGGGTMHNKVVYHALKVLNDPVWGMHFPVLRFNFRGAGVSQGVHDGAAEAGDVAAALDWLENEYNLPLVVAGFSFGAAMALAACCGQGCGKARNVRVIAALGLPTHAEGRDYRYPMLAECAIPKLFLSGDRDLYAPATQLASTVEAAREPKNLVFVPGANHFFSGQLGTMQAELSTWLVAECGAESAKEQRQ